MEKLDRVKDLPMPEEKSQIQAQPQHLQVHLLIKSIQGIKYKQKWQLIQGVRSLLTIKKYSNEG